MAPPCGCSARGASGPAAHARGIGPQNPVDALAPADPALPALAESDQRVTALLAELLGRDKLASFW